VAALPENDLANRYPPMPSLTTTLGGTIAAVCFRCQSQRNYEFAMDTQLPPFSIGFVSLIGVMLMAPISSFTATYGARLAHALPGRWLEVGFGLFLLAVSARFIASLVW
jgi:hypothetical protein